MRKILDLSSAADSIFDSMLLMSHFKRPLSAACWLLAEFLSPVIPGHREAVGPESRAKFAIRSSGFRARAFSAPRNDRGEFFSKLLERYAFRLVHIQHFGNSLRIRFA